MSKSLIKLIDSSLLPSAVMIIGKVVGIYISAQLFNLEWALQTVSNSIFSLKPVFYQNDIATVSSYSDLFMLLFVLLGLSLMVFRAVYLHSTHIDPRFIAKLATNNLLELVKDSFDVYHDASIWLVFTWLSTLTIFGNILLEKTYIWVGVVAVVSAISFSIILLRDVVKEVEISRKKITENYA